MVNKWALPFRRRFARAHGVAPSVHRRSFARGSGALRGRGRRNVFRVFRPSHLRLALQLVAGSVAVHELRYRLGADHAERSLGDHGHAYLSVLTPLLGLSLVLATAHFLWALWARRPEAAGSGRISVGALAAALLVLHLGQEAMEAAVAFGRPLDVAAFLGDGGWLAAPLCVLVAALIAWLTRGAQRLARAALARGGDPAPSAPRPVSPAAPFVLRFLGPPLAHHGAERAPPLLAT